MAANVFARKYFFAINVQFVKKNDYRKFNILQTCMPCGELKIVSIVDTAFLEVRDYETYILLVRQKSIIFKRSGLKYFKLD